MSVMEPPVTRYKNPRTENLGNYQSVKCRSGGGAAREMCPLAGAVAEMEMRPLTGGGAEREMGPHVEIQEMTRRGGSQYFPFRICADIATQQQSNCIENYCNISSPSRTSNRSGRFSNSDRTQGRFFLQGATTLVVCAGLICVASFQAGFVNSLELASLTTSRIGPAVLATEKTSGYSGNDKLPTYACREHCRRRRDMTRGDIGELPHYQLTLNYEEALMQVRILSERQKFRYICECKSIEIVYACCSSNKFRLDTVYRVIYTCNIFLKRFSTISIAYNNISFTL